MTTDKDKGIVGLASDRLRETNGGGPMALGQLEGLPQQPQLPVGQRHRAREQGTGGKPLCEECERLNSLGGPIGNLTNL
jgi:hypothetical protein